MKKFCFLFILPVVLIACQTGSDKVAQEGQIGLKVDGYYQCVLGKIAYLLRFSPQGNVVLTAGDATRTKEIADMLDPTVPDANNIYNVEYLLQENDSVFFYTVSPKGRIYYRGSIVHEDTIRMFKESAINGKTATLDYYFVPHSY